MVKTNTTTQKFVTKVTKAKPAYTVRPDGMRSTPEKLSFTSRIETPTGRHIRYDFFDVPAQNYAEGDATGYRAAAELLKALALNDGPHIFVHRILEDVAAANTEKFTGVSRRAAAGAFTMVVTDALKFFAKHANHGEYLQKRMAESEQYAQTWAAQEATERAEFVARMKAGKAAKQAQLEQIGGAS